VGVAPAGGGDGNGTGANGVGPDNKGTPSGDNVDLLDPANNELIPTF